MQQRRWTAEQFAPFPDPIPDPSGVVAEWLRHAAIEPIAFGRWSVGPDWNLHHRVVRNDMWYCCLEGTGRVRLGAQGPWKAFAPGMLFLVPEDTVHSVELHRNVVMMNCTAHFSARIWGGLSLVRALDMGGLYAPRAGETIFPDASQALAREEALAEPGARTAQIALIWTVLMHVLRHEGSRLRIRAAGQLSNLAYLRPAFQLVEEQFKDPCLSVSDLAASVNLSTVALRKRFRLATGASPITFLRRYRIDQACRRLQDASLTVKEVAVACGFSNAHFFHRVFRAVTGTTPKHMPHVLP